MEYGSERPQDEARRKAEKDAEQLKRDAGQLKREGAEAVQRQAESGKERAASELDSLSEAVDKAASALSEEDKEGLANTLRQASEQMSTLSRHLHERSIDQLTKDAKRMASRNPTAFLFGSIAIGFALSRFLKATSPDTREYQEMRQDMGRHAHDMSGEGYAGDYGRMSSPGAAGGTRPSASPSPGSSTYRSPGTPPGATPGSDIHH